MVRTGQAACLIGLVMNLSQVTRAEEHRNQQPQVLWVCTLYLGKQGVDKITSGR